MAPPEPSPNDHCRLQVQALQSPHGGPFTLTVEPGECVAVVGRSGAGKSVLLRLIADLDPHDGDVWLGGRARASWTAPQWRRQVVYQAAEPAWWAATARAHLPASSLPGVAALLPELELDPTLLEVDISRLSTGERQRLALVRSLSCEPRVLLLDEPTAALDPVSTRAVEVLLAARVAAGMPLIVVTHSEAQAERVGQRLFELRERRLHPR